VLGDLAVQIPRLLQGDHVFELAVHLNPPSSASRRLRRSAFMR
jgi:hypothetical protein